MSRFSERFNIIEDNFDNRYLQITLYGVIGFCFVTVIGIFFATMLGGNSNVQVVMFFAGIILFILLGLTYQQRLLIPRLSIPFLGFLFVTYLIVMSTRGIRDTSVYAYFLFMTLAGLLLGTLGVVLFTTVMIISLWIIFYAQNNGYMVNPVVSSLNLADVAVLSVLWLTTGSVLSLTIYTLKNTIQRVRGQEQSLLAANYDLEQIRLSLESTVQERTQRVEIALQEAETAKQQMADQVWLASGQAQLAQVMRGEQAMSDLANNVIRQICTYLEIPTGALFVMQEGQLVLAGGYAFSPYASEMRFSIGEGLVGEAAKQRQPLMVDAQSEHSWQVVYGTMVHDVRHISIYPFLFEEAVMGVVELGSLSSLTPVQQAFLQIIMESVGIAFHGAYTRSQMNALLRFM